MTYDVKTMIIESIILIHILPLSATQNRKLVSKELAIKYPSFSKRKTYNIIEIITRANLPHFAPFQISTSVLVSPLKRFVTARVSPSKPNITPDQKGKNPGPGDRTVPIPASMESAQTITDIPTHIRPVN